MCLYHYGTYPYLYIPVSLIRKMQRMVSRYGFFSLLLAGKAPSFFLTFIILSSGSLSAQFISQADFEPAPDFETSYQRGIEALAAGSPAQAERHFEEATKLAASRKDRDAKSKAREAQKRVARFYEPLYERLGRLQEAPGGGDLKAAHKELQALRALVDRYQGEGAPEFQPIDQALSNRVDQQLAQVDRQRTEQVQRHLSTGQQRYQSGDFDGAVAALQAAQALILPEEEGALQEQAAQLSDLAGYQKHWSQAQTALAGEDFRGALQALELARQHQDSPEVRNQIEEVSKRMHYQALEAAQQAFFEEQYELARATMDTAAIYAESEVLTRLEEKAQQILRNRGRNAVQAQDFETALHWYELAATFKDDELVREEIAQVKDLDKHHDAYADAVDLLEAGKLKSARRKLRRADRFGDNPAVDNWIGQIDQYYEHLKAGKKSLKKDDPEEALRRFRAAEALFATGEIREYVGKAERAAARTITPDDLY